MLFSFKMLTSEPGAFRKARVCDDEQVIPFVTGREDVEHYFTNIPVRGEPRVEFDGDHSIEVLSLSDEAYMTTEQVELNNGLTAESRLRYRITVRGEPNKAVIGVPAYRGDRGFAAPYAVLPVERFDVEDALYLSFQDPYLTSGSYFVCDSYGAPVVSEAVDLIRSCLGRLGISEADTTFVGASKGANIAGIVSDHFAGNQLIVPNYAMDIDYWCRNTGQAHLPPAVAYYGLTFPDATEILRRQAQDKEVHWLYSVGDDRANMGLEEISEPCLTVHRCEEPHGRLFVDRWDDVRRLIADRYA